jgi:hypothetical protein
VTEGTIGTALRRGVELLRRRPLAVLAGGLALRLAALAPLAGRGAALSAGPGGSGLRPVVLLSLPAATLLVRWWWLALVVEIAAERPRGAPDRA